LKKQILSGLIIAASAVIVISFFMPWARVGTSLAEVSKGLTGAAEGKLGDKSLAGKLVGKLKKATEKVSSVADIRVKATVSGYDIPVMVNRKSSKAAIAIAQVIFKSAENSGPKSFLVYLLPLLGIFCGAAAVLGLKKKLYFIAMLAISGAVSITGLYNLYTADPSGLIVKISIEKGLWLTMYAFLLIFIVSIMQLTASRD
jgi:hypothetical protein